MLQVQALESTASRLLAAGQLAAAVPFVLLVLKSDPLRESAQQLLIAIHIRQGNISDALRQFDGCRTRLRAELGIEPGLRVTALVAQYVTRAPLGGVRGA